MNIGDLKHRITIQQFTTTVNNNGFEVEDWINYKTIWASISNLHGREYFQAAAVQAEKTIKFTVRYNQNINTDMRIVFNSKNYDIKFIDNIKYENKFMEIQGLEVVASA